MRHTVANSGILLFGHEEHSIPPSGILLKTWYKDILKHKNSAIPSTAQGRGFPCGGLNELTRAIAAADEYDTVTTALGADLTLLRDLMTLHDLQGLYDLTTTQQLQGEISTESANERYVELFEMHEQLFDSQTRVELQGYLSQNEQQLPPAQLGDDSSLADADRRAALFTPQLLEASMRGDHAEAQRLIAEGANQSLALAGFASTVYGETARGEEIIMEKAQFLIDMDASPTLALVYLVKGNRIVEETINAVAAAARFLLRLGARPSTALGVIASGRNHNEAQFLIELGADPERALAAMTERGRRNVDAVMFLAELDDAVGVRQDAIIAAAPTLD